MTDTAISFYNDKLVFLSSKIKKYGNICRYIAIFRLLLFVAAIAAAILFYIYRSFNPTIILISVVLFIILVLYGFPYKRELKRLSNLKKFIEAEIMFKGGDYGYFRNCSHFTDYTHEFANDLDIFEKGSIFQNINRCATIEGEIFLKDLILNTKRDGQTILSYQNAVKELITMRDFSHDLSSLGLENVYSLKDFINEIYSGTDKVSKKILIFSYISSLVTAISFVLYGLGIIASFIPLGLFIYQLALSSFFTKKINKIYLKANKTNKSAEVYENIGNIILNSSFTSELLKSNSVIIKDMAKSIRNLRKINDEFDGRNNGLIYLITNGIFLRDIALSHKIGEWFANNIERVDSWTGAAAEIDALNSISSFAFNNADFIFPNIDDTCVIKAENMVHPLISKEKRIGNDISIYKNHKFFIITGANMAGKSTFIRSIGVNLILASIGSPVCASKFSFTPVPLFTSMRTGDKLLESSSYFQAELARLKALMEKASKEKFMLVLLDEILKGTNSSDKLQGSRMVLLKFASMDLSGVLATHDTALGELEKEYPENFQNLYFDWTANESGEMMFDYKLRTGVSSNMNAAILLKSILDTQK